NADPAGFLDHVVDGDPNVRKCLRDTSDDGFDALRAVALPGGQRNVVPRRSEDFIDKIGVLVAERPIEGLHGVAFNAKSFGEVSAGGAHYFVPVVVGGDLGDGSTIRPTNNLYICLFVI